MNTRNNRSRRLPHNIIRSISKSGHCSRKQALEMVMAGRVTVNGKVVLDPGFKPRKTDRISIDGRPLVKSEPVYLMLNKPAGYVTTRSDELGRPTVYEFLTGIRTWVSPVGRLDMDSEGLILITNDTAFSDHMTDPKNKIPRTYMVSINKHIAKEDVDAMLAGVDIGHGQVSKPTSLEIVDYRADRTTLRVTLVEGKNREIRRLFERFGASVEKLLRVGFGPFSLGDLPQGKILVLDIETINNIKRSWLKEHR